jgi:TonB family protein
LRAFGAGESWVFIAFWRWSAPLSPYEGMPVMSNKKLALCIGMMISFLSVGVYAQSAGPELNYFDVDGISFHYPSGYSVKDESTPEAHQFVITRTGSSVQLTIVVPKRLAPRSQWPEVVEDFTQPTLKKVSMTLGEGKNSPEQTRFQTRIGTIEAEGIRLRSAPEKKTGEIIWGRSSLHLVGLVFVRSDADESAGAQLWETVNSSLKLASGVLTVVGSATEPTDKTKIEGGVLNGKALALPQPAYPAIARAAHASGTVSVQVLIDEEGNVIAAHAVDGHPLLQAASVAAARQARFSPTLLEGEPVRVTGIIQYNFIAR